MALGWLVSSGSAGRSGVETAAVVIGGVGSAIGGGAAAVAARSSLQSARASDESVDKMNQIALDSRVALGRAMKTEITPRIDLSQDDPWLALDIDTRWPVLDPSISVRIPGRDDKHMTWEGDLRALYGTLELRLPAPPDDVEHLLTPAPWVPSVPVLKCAVVLQFMDRDRILTHQNSYLIHAQVSEKDEDGHRKFVGPMRRAKLVEQLDWLHDEAPPSTRLS